MIGPDEEAAGTVRWKPMDGAGEQVDLVRAEALARLRQGAGAR